MANTAKGVEADTSDTPPTQKALKLHSFVPIDPEGSRDSV
jgi:hypothetical protein